MASLLTHTILGVVTPTDNDYTVVFEAGVGLTGYLHNLTTHNTGISTEHIEFFHMSNEATGNKITKMFGIELKSNQTINYSFRGVGEIFESGHKLLAKASTPNIINIKATGCYELIDTRTTSQIGAWGLYLHDMPLDVNPDSGNELNTSFKTHPPYFGLVSKTNGEYMVTTTKYYNFRDTFVYIFKDNELQNYSINISGNDIYTTCEIAINDTSVFVSLYDETKSDNAFVAQYNIADGVQVHTFTAPRENIRFGNTISCTNTHLYCGAPEDGLTGSVISFDLSTYDSNTMTPNDDTVRGFGKSLECSDSIIAVGAPDTPIDNDLNVGVVCLYNTTTHENYETIVPNVSNRHSYLKFGEFLAINNYNVCISGYGTEDTDSVDIYGYTADGALNYVILANGTSTLDSMAMNDDILFISKTLFENGSERYVTDIYQSRFNNFLLSIDRDTSESGFPLSLSCSDTYVYIGNPLAEHTINGELIHAIGDITVYNIESLLGQYCRGSLRHATQPVTADIDVPMPMSTATSLLPTNTMAQNSLYYAIASPGSNYVKVYSKDDDTLAANITSPDSGTTRFGNTIVLNEDYLIIAAEDTNDTAGIVYVFSASDWSLVETIHKPSPLNTIAFGCSMAINNGKLFISDPLINTNAHLQQETIHYKWVDITKPETPPDIQSTRLNPNNSVLCDMQYNSDGDSTLRVFFEALGDVGYNLSNGVYSSDVEHFNLNSLYTGQQPVVEWIYDFDGTFVVTGNHSRLRIYNTETGDIKEYTVPAAADNEVADIGPKAFISGENILYDTRSRTIGPTRS